MFNSLLPAPALGLLKKLNDSPGKKQVLLFLVVGVANTAFSYGLYALFLWLGLSYKAANLLSISICVFVTFKTQGSIVFGNRSNKAIFKYIALWSVLYFVNIWLIGQFIGIGFNSYQAGALALIPITVTSFFLQKYVVFRKAA